MGGKCSKASKEAVSENVQTDAHNDMNPASRLSTKNEQEEAFGQGLSRGATGGFNEPQLSPLESRKDSTFSTGMLPFQNATASFTGQESSLGLSGLVEEPQESVAGGSLYRGSQNASLNASRRVSADEPEGVARENSLGNSLDSYASTYVSNDSADADPTIEMRTYTPFDMKRTDEVAKFLVQSCGFGLEPGHNPQKCAICSALDMSDTPLIA